MANELSVRDVKIAELSIRIESLENTHDKMSHTLDRAQRYTNVMLEDLITRVSKMENAATRFETNLVHVNGNGSSTNTRLTDIETRLRSIERLAYIAIGGMTSVTGLCAFFGWQALKILAKP